MKANSLIILLMSIPFVGLAQMKHSVDLIGGVDYSYRHLSTSSEDATVIGIFDNRNNKESGKSNWRIGANYNLGLTEKIFLRTGLRLSSVGYKGEKRTDLRWPDETNVFGEWVPDPNLPREVQIIYDYWFIDIPIVGRFEISEQSLSPFVELGMSPSIYVTRRTQSITDLGTDTNFQKGNVHNFNRLHLVGFASAGLNYSITDTYQLFGQAAFRYHLTKMVDAPISEYLFNYGIEFGIRRQLN